MIADYINKNNINSAINLYFSIKSGDKLIHKYTNEKIEVLEDAKNITEDDKILILNNAFFEKHREIKINTKFGIKTLFSLSDYMQYKKVD